MKRLIFLVFSLFAGTILSTQAQEKGPIPKISQQLNDYFSYYPLEKVFMMTDKTQYRPGETIWFRAFVTDPNNFSVPENGYSLYVKLYNRKGIPVAQDVYKITQGIAPGDLTIPDDLEADQYFLVAYAQSYRSADRISCTPLLIDPQYSSELAAETHLKNSISIAGQKNELSVLLRDVTGEIQKKDNIRYQFMNGSEVLDKGKLKTDDEGKVVVELAIPEKTNGEPFICELSDSRDSWKQEVWIPTNLDPLVIHQYPESGILVQGIPAKIGFTVFTKWRIPVDVEGKVFDQDGTAVSLFKTFTKGLGLFTLSPDSKQNYKLVISGPTGQNQTFDVPAPGSTGLALSVVKTDTAFIFANFIFADKQKHAVATTVSRAGKLYWAADLEVNGSARIKIPTENLPQGINLLSVFSSDGQLIAERILFTDKNQVLKVEIHPEKNTLKQNESMKVKVRLTDEKNQPVSGNVAISVSDKFLNESSPDGIEKYMSVGSGLETPFSLISDAFKGKVSNTALLDVFLIANRIIWFNWETILKFKPGNAPDVGTINNEIRGQVTDKNGDKVSKAKVSLVNGKNMQLYSTISDEDGAFTFPNLNTATTDDFTAKATDADGKRELNVTFSKNFEGQISEFVKKVAPQYFLAGNEPVVDEKYSGNNPFLFQKAPKVTVSNTGRLDSQRRLLESSTSLLDVIKSIKPFKIVNNQIVFIGSENSLNYQGGALLIIDGQQMGTDISSIGNVSPLEVDHINVSTNVMDIQRYTGLNSVGIVEIFLKKGKPTEVAKPIETANKYEGGFRVPNVFSETGKANDNENTTLLWIPEQQIDNSGEFEFTITAGKVISDFVIEVQGTSGVGRIGSGKAEFSVTK